MTDKQPEEELHPAIQLLLKRMDSNPEEFMGGLRWRKIMDAYENSFSEAEKKALTEKSNKIRMDKMYEKIMGELLDPKTTSKQDPQMAPGTWRDMTLGEYERRKMEPQNAEHRIAMDMLKIKEEQENQLRQNRGIPRPDWLRNI